MPRWPSLRIGERPPARASDAGIARRRIAEKNAAIVRPDNGEERRIEMATKKVGLVGALAKVKPEDAARLAIYVVRGTEILAHGDVGAQGNFRVDVARCAADDQRFGL